MLSRSWIQRALEEYQSKNFAINYEQSDTRGSISFPFTPILHANFEQLVNDGRREKLDARNDTLGSKFSVLQSFSCLNGIYL